MYSTENDILAAGDKHFTPLCLAHFAFLVSDYDFALSAVAVANETVIDFSSGDLIVRVFHAIPELPFLHLQLPQQKKPTKVSIRFSSGCRKLQREYMQCLEATSDSRWWTQYTNGAFTDHLDATLAEIEKYVRDEIESWVQSIE